MPVLWSAGHLNAATDFSTYPSHASHSSKPVLFVLFAQRGWTNTFNVWAGDGGWRSAPARAFHVSGVPSTCLVDAGGRIVVAGHQATINISDQVDAALKKQ